MHADFRGGGPWVDSGQGARFRHPSRRVWACGRSSVAASSRRPAVWDGSHGWNRRTSTTGSLDVRGLGMGGLRVGVRTGHRRAQRHAGTVGALRGGQEGSEGSEGSEGGCL